MNIVGNNNMNIANLYNRNKKKTVGFICFSLQVKELAEKARAGKLAPHQYQGGTFR